MGILPTFHRRALCSLLGQEMFEGTNLVHMLQVVMMERLFKLYFSGETLALEYLH